MHSPTSRPSQTSSWAGSNTVVNYLSTLTATFNLIFLSLETFCRRDFLDAQAPLPVLGRGNSLLLWNLFCGNSAAQRKDILQRELFYSSGPISVWLHWQEFLSANIIFYIIVIPFIYGECISYIQQDQKPKLKRRKLHKITRKWPRLACVECPSAGLMLLRDSTAWVLHKPARALTKTYRSWKMTDLHSAVSNYFSLSEYFLLRNSRWLEF